MTLSDISYENNQSEIMTLCLKLSTISTLFQF